ncbi:hypothetical protein SSX86_013320 [Deinandra increscens subsp. villosa]|uniref:Cytochrome P450 n=1 Tax=Deinandra increscens subsp. villosa TaxID=3103831 RepID=A0AAP0DDE8_9ASTR
MASNINATWWEEATGNKNELAAALLALMIITLAISWYKKTILPSSDDNGIDAPPLPPGPKGLPLVGYFPFLSPNLHHEFTQMANRYGPIFKLYLGSKLHVVVNSAELAKVVTGEQDESFANRDAHIAGLATSYNANDVAFAPNNANRRKLRKILVHEVLSNTNLEASRFYRTREVRKTIKDVHNMIGMPVDINEVSFSTVLNILTNIVWGKGMVAGSKHNNLTDEIRKVVTGVVEIAEGLNISDFFPMLARFDLQGVRRKMERQMKQFDRIFESTIEERTGSKSEKIGEEVKQDGTKDLLEILLELKDDSTMPSINMTQLKALVVDIFLGGTDATSAMVEWAMTEILRNQKVMTKVQDELAEVVGLNNIVEESHLPKLKYLEAVFKETFRLHPPLPFLLPRAPNQTCIVGGYTIPKGTTIFLNVWAIQRDPKYWDSPSEFIPERFLNYEGLDNCDYSGTNSKFFPFGSGRRRCPGVSLGEKMMMHILGSLMHSFDWSLPKGNKHDLSEKFGIAMKKKIPLVVIPSRRMTDFNLYIIQSSDSEGVYLASLVLVFPQFFRFPPRPLQFHYLPPLFSALAAGNSSPSFSIRHRHRRFVSIGPWYQFTVAMTAMDVETGVIQRKQSLYKSLDEMFEIQKEMYRGQQYSQIYYIRLHLIRTLIYSLLPTWKPHLPVCTVLGLEGGKECILVGTLYKHMKLKPTILSEYSKERSAAPLVVPDNFVHPDDTLVLEDESGRVNLKGNLLSPSVYVTGNVVAVHGKETGGGDFYVEDVLEAGLPPQLDPPNKLGEDKYVVLVSGLNIGSSSSNPLQLQLLVDHITGHLGDEKVQSFSCDCHFRMFSSNYISFVSIFKQEQHSAAQIVQVIVAGNSVQLHHGLLNGQNLASKDQSKLAEPIKELDIFLTQIAASIPIDIMPGYNDPANFAMPQQPLNRCLFPGSSAYNTFRSCTNPHLFDVDNVRFLGTSGQNIDDLGRYSEAKDTLEFMERTMRWRHLAPTAPNTLGCYPFTDRDPFFMESCPHVYFVGNQDKYATQILKGIEGQVVRLVSIPKFSETGVAVMVNLRNLECTTLNFGIQISS